MNFRLSIFVILWFFVGSNSYAEPAFFVRTPALIPDASVMVFSCQGDLWSIPIPQLPLSELNTTLSSKPASKFIGSAKRLTVHSAYDYSPIISPDGKTIAFASNRYSTFDLFTIPLEGGNPVRLTFSQSDEKPLQFSDDGNTLYYSGRELFEYPMYEQILQIPITGGTPFRVFEGFASQIAFFSPSEYVITVGPSIFGRKNYRGSYQNNLWKIATDGQEQLLTTHRGYDDFPQIPSSRDYIYYRSDESGTFNLWRMKPDASEKTQCTFFQDDGIRSYQLSRNGQYAVIEADSSVYFLRCAPLSNPVQLTMDVANDNPELPEIILQTRSDADELSVTTDGNEYAMVIHSELVLISRELGGRGVIPSPSFGRDFQPQFRPNSDDTLLFCTDRWGYRAVALLVSEDSGSVGLRKAKSRKLIRITIDSADCHLPKWSPDGKWMGYVKSNGELWLCDSNGQNHQRFLDGWSSITYEWSPDSRWIAYSRDDEDYNSDIWIAPINRSIVPVNISQHPDEDLNPKWSQDGSILAWTTRRHSNQFDLYYVYLKKSEDERTVEEWKEWEKTRDKKKDDDSPKDDADKKKKKPSLQVDSVVIDFDRIHLRSRRLTDWKGTEEIVAIDPKGDRFYFSAEVQSKTDLYSINRFGEDLKSITDGGTNPSSITLQKDGKTFHYLQNGAPRTIPVSGGKSEKTDFQARLNIRTQAERLYVLDEGWRGIDRGFYDPQMHGVDWQKMRYKYRRYAEQVTHRKDFEDVAELMLGELNASHMGFGYGRDSDPKWVAGELGIYFDDSYPGEGLRIKTILPESPASAKKSNLQVGDVIIQIDNTPVNRQTPLGSILQGKMGISVTVQVQRQGKMEEGSILPDNWYAIRDVAYQWMEQINRKLVDSLSNGELAYIHIQGMNRESLELFERDLYAVANGKQGLVIDVRDNGGGSTTDLLLTILTQPEHAYTIGRNGKRGYPQDRLPLYRWTKPIVVLCNEGSFSNAEIFAHSIQVIKRGIVVGTETAGGVISTSGWGTIDGGYFQLPLRGWYRIDTNQNLENGGCVPDIVVPITPNDRIQKRDPQLLKAIQVLSEKK